MKLNKSPLTVALSLLSSTFFFTAPKADAHVSFSFGAGTYYGPTYSYVRPFYNAGFYAPYYSYASTPYFSYAPCVTSTYLTTGPLFSGSLLTPSTVTLGSFTINRTPSYDPAVLESGKSARERVDYLKTSLRNDVDLPDTTKKSGPGQMTAQVKDIFSQSEEKSTEPDAHQ